MISTRATGLDIGARLGFHLGPHGCAGCPVETGCASVPYRTTVIKVWRNHREREEPRCALREWVSRTAQATLKRLAARSGPIEFPGSTEYGGLTEQYRCIRD